jgi:RNA-directed DNA polymerase
VPVDNLILKKWLKTDFIEDNEYFSTTEGTPQGGIISPTLLTITLSELEETVHAAIPQRESKKKRSKIHFSIYADDFIITGY